MAVRVGTATAFNKAFTILVPAGSTAAPSDKRISIECTSDY
jgi:hypothetical protein